MVPASFLRFPRFFAVALALGLLCIILGAKLNLLERDGSDLPFWDQWDAEGDFLFRPHLERGLTAADFFRAHNEHRPVFTRALSLALLELGDRQWDARVQLVVNAALHAAIALLLLALARRALPPLGAFAFAGFTALFFCTSVSWENTLAGFQSQFYFVLLFTVLHVAGTLLARPRSPAWWLAPLAGLAALFSMASGALSAMAILAAVGVQLVRRWASASLTTPSARQPSAANCAKSGAVRHAREGNVVDGDVGEHPLSIAYVVVANLALTVLGLWLKADVPGHATLKAASAGGWFDAFLHQFAWPITLLWAAPLGLIPTLCFGIAYLRRRVQGPIALTLLAACAWFVLQAAAIAYARGAEMHGYSSRYCDTLAVGVVINFLALAYLAATAPTPRSRRRWIGGTIAFAALSTWGLSREAATTYHDTLHDMPMINAAREACVRSYVASHDPAFFKKSPWDELPYPSADRLASLLDNPALRSLLPASVRPPVALAPESASHGFDAYPGADAPAGPPPFALGAWISAPGPDAQFTTQPFVIDHSRVTVFVAAQPSGRAELRLIDDHGRVFTPLGRLASSPRWKRVHFHVPHGRYRFEASHTGAGWIALTQPTTTTALSDLALRVVHLGPWFLLSGTLLSLLAGASLFRDLTREGRDGSPSRPSPADTLHASAAAPSTSMPHARPALRTLLASATTILLGLALATILLARLGVIPTYFSSEENPPLHGGRPVVGFGLREPASGQLDDKFVNAAFFASPPTQRWFGTFVEGDGYTGKVASTTFPLGGTALFVPITGYPALAGNSLTLEILADATHPAAMVQFSGEDPREQPGMWRLDVSAWRGREARLVLQDGLTKARGWLAVGIPQIGTSSGPGWLAGVSRDYAWYSVVALAFGGLLFIPGLAWRGWLSCRSPVGASLADARGPQSPLAKTRAPSSSAPTSPPHPAGAHRAASPYLHAALLAVPGLLLLAATGLLVWIGGPGGMDFIIDFWLAGLVLAAGAVAIAWLRRGITLDRGETEALGLYACVVIAALAFGVLPLEVAHESDAHSTAQSRMSDGPPDYFIPYRTAGYFFHQKNGREDRAVYFGNEWSAGSRGPLAPLAITAGYAVANAAPSNPPGYSAERWPATRDGYFAARIIGILTNALVVLAAAALAFRLRALRDRNASTSSVADDSVATARIALVWCAVAPVVLANTDFLWPKLLATFFLLLAVVAILERQPVSWIAAWSALAYLSHPVGGLLLPVLFTFALFRAAMDRMQRQPRRTRRDEAEVRDLSAAGSPHEFGPLSFILWLAAWLLPWFAFKAWVNHPDLFLHYPLGDGHGFARAANIGSWLHCRWDNIWYTLVPGAFQASDKMAAWSYGPLSAPLRWAIGYSKTLPGQVGFVAFIAVAFATFARRATPGFRTHLIFGGFALMVFFWGFSNDGLGRNCLEPLSILLIAYTASTLAPSWRGWPWLLLVTALEALSLRVIEITTAASFTPAALNPEVLQLATITALATLAPAVWYLFRSHQRGGARA